MGHAPSLPNKIGQKECKLVVLEGSRTTKMYKGMIYKIKEQKFTKVSWHIDKYQKWRWAEEVQSKPVLHKKEKQTKTNKET